MPGQPASVHIPDAACHSAPRQHRRPAAARDVGGRETAQRWFNTYALVLELQLGLDTITARASFDSRVMKLQTVQGLLERLDFVMQQLDRADPDRDTVGR